MKKKKVLLLGAGLVLSCFTCCCGSFLSIPPTDIVGLYDDEPIWGPDYWHEQWEFKDSGVGTVTMKTAGGAEETVVHFKYRYTRQFPTVNMAWYTPQLVEIVAHSLELSECTGEAGKLPPTGLGTRGEPDRPETLVEGRRFKVWVNHVGLV